MPIAQFYTATCQLRGIFNRIQSRQLDCPRAAEPFSEIESVKHQRRVVPDASSWLPLYFLVATASGIMRQSVACLPVIAITPG